MCIWTDDNSLLDYVKTHCSLIITSHANVLTAVDSCTDLPQTELNSFSKLQQKTKTKKKRKREGKILKHSHGYGVSHFHVFVGVRLLPLSLV